MKIIKRLILVTALAGMSLYLRSGGTDLRPLQIEAIVIVILLVIRSCWFLMTESSRVHGELKRIRQLAQGAVTESALRAIRADLVTFARANCHLRAYGDHARLVLSYIDGRLDAFKKQ